MIKETMVENRYLVRYAPSIFASRNGKHDITIWDYASRRPYLGTIRDEQGKCQITGKANAEDGFFYDHNGRYPGSVEIAIAELCGVSPSYA